MVVWFVSCPMFVKGILEFTAALKAPNMTAQGSALGQAAPKQIKALKGRHKIDLTRNPRPMAYGS